MDIAWAFGHEIDLHPVKARSNLVLCEICFLKLVGLPFGLFETLIIAVGELNVVGQLMQQDSDVARIAAIPGPHQDDTTIWPIIGPVPRGVDNGSARFVMNDIASSGESDLRRLSCRIIFCRGCDPAKQINYKIKRYRVGIGARNNSLVSCRRQLGSKEM